MALRVGFAWCYVPFAVVYMAVFASLKGYSIAKDTQYKHAQHKSGNTRGETDTVTKLIYFNTTTYY